MSAQAIPIDRPEMEKLEPQAMTFKDRATALVVTDQASLDAAGEMLLGIKELRRKAEEHHRPMIDAAHKAHKATLDALKKIDGPLEEAERIIKPRIGGYLQEQERIRLAEARRLQEEADRLAAEQLEQSIEAAEAGGASPAEVAAIIEQPMVAPAVVAQPTYTPVAGISTAKAYRAEVFNIRELCKAVAMGQVPETYVTANMTALNGVARSTRGSIRIPGVRMVEDTTVRAGGDKPAWQPRRK